MHCKKSKRPLSDQKYLEIKGNKIGRKHILAMEKVVDNSTGFGRKTFVLRSKIGQIRFFSSQKRFFALTDFHVINSFPFDLVP